MASKLGEVSKDIKEEVKSTQIEKLNEAKQANASTETENKSENTKKESEKPQETPKATVTRHVVSYVGNSIWVDRTGQHWSRNEFPGTNIVTSKEYSDEEFKERSDIQFMVSYGEMRVTTVTI